MTKQQDHDELDRSAVGLAEAPVSPADGELPFQPSDATVLTANVEPNDDDVDSRMEEIREILDHAAMPLLDKGELVAEWVRYAEAKLSVFGQIVPKPKGGRPEGGVARAARELPVRGKSPDARRKFIERAIKIDGIWPEAKQAARAAGLHNIQSQLLAIAEEHSPDAQIAKVQEIAARKAMPRRRESSTIANNKSASSSGRGRASKRGTGGSGRTPARTRRRARNRARYSLTRSGVEVKAPITGEVSLVSDPVPDQDR